MGLLTVYALLCCIPGGIASGKGRSFWGFFLLSLIVSPIIGLIGALCCSYGAEELARRDILKDEAKARILGAEAARRAQHASLQAMDEIARAEARDQRAAEKQSDEYWARLDARTR